MPGMLTRYEVTVGRNKTIMQLSDADAKRYPGAKKVARHKARSAPVAGDAAPAGNASTEEWAAHAESLGIDVPDDVGRDDIKALVADAS